MIDNHSYKFYFNIFKESHAGKLKDDPHYEELTFLGGFAAGLTLATEGRGLPADKINTQFNKEMADFFKAITHG